MDIYGRLEEFDRMAASFIDRVTALENTVAELKAIIDSDKLEKQPKIAIPFATIINRYSKYLPTFRPVGKLTESRKRCIRARWKEDLPTVEHWENYFLDIASSKFLTSPEFRQNDIDWVINAANFTKIMEGKYHDSVRKQVR